MLIISSDAPLSLSVSISVPQASLRPAYLLSLIGSSEISQEQRGEIVQELFFIFHLVSFILPLCASLSSLKQLSNRTGSSALTITTKVWEDFERCFVLNGLPDCSVDA